MGIKTVPHPPYSPDLAPCNFWLFTELRGYLYETIEEMKEAVTKVIDTLTQENFHGALQKLLEWYNKCIAAGGDYLEGDKNFMCVLSIKVPIRKKSGNLFNDPRIYPVEDTYNAPFRYNLKHIHFQQQKYGKFSPKTQQYYNIKITNKNIRFLKHSILETCNPKLTELIFKPVLMYVSVFRY